MLTEERVGPGGHGPDVQGVADVPGQGGEEGVGAFALEDEVPVQARPGGPAGVEAGRGRSRGAHHHGGTEHGVHGPDESDTVHRAHHVGVDHLTGGMDTGVRAAGTGQIDRLAQGGGQGAAELAGHGALPGLGGEAPEAGSVVGDHQPQPDPFGPCSGVVRPVLVPRRHRAGVGGVEQRQTNSMRAMGALSPWRGPSFRIRV